LVTQPVIAWHDSDETISSRGMTCYEEFILSGGMILRSVQNNKMTQ